MKPLLSEINSGWGWGEGEVGRRLYLQKTAPRTPLPPPFPDACRKRAVEEELDSCRARLRTVEAQLLEVLQEKLRLKQEVEAWEVGRGV